MKKKITTYPLSIVVVLSLFLCFSTKAQSGAALNFDGTNDNVNIGSQSSLSATTAFTVETWLKRTAGSYIYPVFFSKSATDWAVNSINFGGWSSGAGIYARVAGASDAYGYNIGNMLPADTWTHVAVVYDGSGSNNAARLKIYINGSPISLTFVGTIPATSATISANATLGVATGSSHFWKGGMDEVRVWNRALCQGEIENNKSCELGGTQSGLQAYYKFNQGTGEGSNGTETSLTDASGNSNTGTLTNFALSGTTSNWVGTGGVTSGVSCSTYTAPEINLTGDGSNITYGSTTPATSNHTDFGSVTVNTSFARTFTIDNTAGTATLNISSIASTNVLFALSNIPATVASGGTTTFTVTFNPTAATVQTATITVNNDDCNEGTYTFAVTGTGSAVLAAELVSFKGQNTEGGNLLSFKTATEQNVDFTIERSRDGQSFTPLSNLKAKGSNSDYTYLDAQPFAGNNYYRLKINDLDGKTDYSKIISIATKGKGNSVVIYPTLVSTGFLNLTIENTEGGYFTIFNLLGQAVLTGKTTTQIDVSALAAGTYVFKMGTGQAKFIKQ